MAPPRAGSHSRFSPRWASRSSLSASVSPWAISWTSTPTSSSRPCLGRKPRFEDYLEVRSATPSNFSPDGTKVLVQSNLSGTLQLYVAAVTGGELRAVTNFDEPVAGAYLPTSNDIVVSVSARGDERSQLSIIGDDGSRLRRLVHDPEHVHRLGGVRRGRSC